MPAFKERPPNDAVRNLIHESAHGASPLGGPSNPTDGTEDLAYRHERMLFKLSTADRLRNRDSYAMFALTLREVQTTGNAAAVPAGIRTPSTDTLTGFGAEQPVLELAVARLEKRTSWAKDEVQGAYAYARAVRAGTESWSVAAYGDVMREAAKRFPLTPPTDPSTTTSRTRFAWRGSWSAACACTRA